MDSESLWPSDIAKVDEIRSPLAILKEQASQLGRATKNILVAEVLPISGFKHPTVGYAFLSLHPHWQIIDINYSE